MAFADIVFLFFAGAFALTVAGSPILIFLLKRLRIVRKDDRDFSFLIKEEVNFLLKKVIENFYEFLEPEYYILNNPITA